MSTVQLRDWTSQHYIQNESACLLLLDDSDRLEQIPSLNSTCLDELKDGQLVRFRGMIQDMYDPEYYFEHYEVKNRITGMSQMHCGMYMDSAKCLNEEKESIEMDSENNKISERHTCIVISIPGLNDWAKEKAIPHSRKLQSTSSDTAKRELCKDQAQHMDCSEPPTKKEKTVHFPENGKTDSVKKSYLSTEHILNFPIPIEDGKACIVKVYNENVSYKLNQIIDIVGFISLDPILGTIHNSDEIDDPEIQTHNPPPSIIPRLHAIKIIEETTNCSDPNDSVLLLKTGSIRSDLHMVLSQLLFGDNLAADYLICHLISAVYMRKDHLCLGSFPINITNFPLEKHKTFTRDLYHVLTTFLPKSHYLECTLDGLNDMSLIPKKDYECNRLTSGILQLSKNTHLVIDETGLTSGQVSASGKQNYEAMSDMIQFQKVNYDFKYFTMEYETDIPVLIFSEVKSFLPCVMQVVLKVDRETEELYPQVFEAASQYLRDEERLENIREYLRVLRNAEFIFDQCITAVIQEDFVKLRQSNKNFGADNLHSLLVLARLMSLSMGKNILTLDCWKQTVRMEHERMERLPQRNK